MVIDFHAHIYPEKVAEKAVRATRDFYSIETQCESAAVEALIEKGRAGGIDRFVVFSAAQSPAQVHSINDFIAHSSGNNPMLTGFGTLHKDMDNPAAEIARIKELGLKGIKLHPDMQQFAIDDEGMFGIYELLAQNKLPIIMHCGDYRYTWSHPERLAHVLDLFPKLVVVAAHFGGWSLFDIAMDYLKQRDCYFDVSSSIMFLGRRRATELIKTYGAERMLFGSDFPMWNPGSERETLESLDLTAVEKELIFYKNAQRVLDEG
jgi:Predicted metal-dependent hydrolase of the TIM-barrel fold